jgi:glycosyltransferase involved in cell wall biosynthesis
MLSGALGDNLTILRHNDPTGWITDDDINIPTLTRDYEAIKGKEWDVVIYDDTRTWHILESLNLKAKHKVWYVHGTYHTWKQFQDFANEQLTDYHFLFTDTSRQEYWSRWFKNEPLSTLILPIHLQDYYYTDIPNKRNGKVCAVGSNLLRTSKLYPNPELTSLTMKEMLKFGSDTFHIYGYNEADRQDDYVTIPDEFYKGNAYPIREKLKDYSCAIFTSNVETLGFALLETMAAGVPVICTPKVDFNNKILSSIRNVFCYNSILPYLNLLTGIDIKPTNVGYESRRYANNFINKAHLSWVVGIDMQRFLKHNFPFSNYISKLNGWLEGFK